MTRTLALAALAAVPALVAPAMAADLSTPQGLYDEQMALLTELSEILCSTRTADEMAAAIRELTPRARELNAAVQTADKAALEAIMLTKEAELKQAIARMMPGVMKIALDPKYANNAALQQAMEEFSAENATPGAQ